MGYVDWYEKASEEERVEFLLKAYPPKLVGIRQEHAEVEWFWCVWSNLHIHKPMAFVLIKGTNRDHHFAAVASDSPSFEARPSIQDWDLHQYILSLWGVSVDTHDSYTLVESR
jgi:hypothetical protein